MFMQLCYKFVLANGVIHAIGMYIEKIFSTVVRYDQKIEILFQAKADISDRYNKN